MTDCRLVVCLDTEDIIAFLGCRYRAFPVDVEIVHRHLRERRVTHPVVVDMMIRGQLSGAELLFTRNTIWPAAIYGFAVDL